MPRGPHANPVRPSTNHRCASDTPCAASTSVAHVHDAPGRKPLSLAFAAIVIAVTYAQQADAQVDSPPPQFELGEETATYEPMPSAQVGGEGAGDSTALKRSLRRRHRARWAGASLIVLGTGLTLGSLALESYPDPLARRSLMGTGLAIFGVGAYTTSISGALHRSAQVDLGILPPDKWRQMQKRRWIGGAFVFALGLGGFAYTASLDDGDGGSVFGIAGSFAIASPVLALGTFIAASAIDTSRPDAVQIQPNLEIHPRGAKLSLTLAHPSW